MQQLFCDIAAITITGVPTTSGDWILINAKEKSFYRVDYDSLLRDDINNQLINNHSVIYSTTLL
jgi:hypothetical protein